MAASQPAAMMIEKKAMSSTKAKTILVTGASSGFGREIAIALARAGHRVFGTSRKVATDISVDNCSVRMLQLDVTMDESVRECIAVLLGEAQGIDVLVNNAGSGLTGALEDCESDEIAWQMETNLMGPLRMNQHVLPVMRRQGGGRIITIGSMMGHAALPYQGIYSASKHALEAINETLRFELRGSNIDTTIVCPGDFKTGFTDARVWARNANSSAHGAQMKKTVAIYERDELNGAPPRNVAKLVVSLVGAKSLRVRYFVGPRIQRFGMVMKRLMPTSWFEALIKVIYQLP